MALYAASTLLARTGLGDIALMAIGTLFLAIYAAAIWKILKPLTKH